MGFPLFRFTLNNATAGSQVISEPGGWDDAILKLERDKNYHSLIEFYEQPLLFYGNDGLNNGGYDYVKSVDESQGPEAIVEILIEVSEDEGQSYETLFTGILALDTLREVDFYTIECGIRRDDFWSKFMSRKSIAVNLQSALSLDDTLVIPPSPIVMTMPHQKMRMNGRYENYRLLEEGSYNITYTFTSTNKYAVIDLPKPVLEEVQTKFNYPNVANDELPFELFAVEFAGDYSFDISVYASTSALLALSDRTTNLDAKIQINDNAAETFTITQQGTNGIDGRTLFTFTDVKTLNKGDFVRIYFEYGAAGPQNYSIVYQDFFESYISIEADTLYPATESDSMLIKDAAESIIGKIVGDEDVVLSDYLSVGSPDGCGAKYALMKGLHVRGYTMTEKPFFMSFDEWWSGANPIFNLGLGYELGGSPETNKIRIEQKSYFYNPTTVLNLDYVNNIERSYENDFIFKSIEIGYQKWSAESMSGIDDPQTKRIYRTNFASIGKDDKNLSKFIAASLAIEQTRRNRIEQGRDWRLDEDVMIISLVDGSPTYEPELDQNFQAITDLLNSDTRYNSRLTCARNFIRWLDFYSGCMQWQLADFVFSAGEGNYDMTSQLATDDCDATQGVSEPVVSESQDISPTTQPLFIPVVYEFEHPLTWEEYKTIRYNRNKAIGVSRTNTNHIECFILNLDWEITKRKGKFTVLLRGNREIVESNTGELLATGYAPTVSVMDLMVNANPGLGQSTATGFAPTVTILA